MGGRQELEEARREVGQLAELLMLRQRGLAATLGGGYPQLRSSLWHSEASVTSAAQALTPQMTENKSKVTPLLHPPPPLSTPLSRPCASPVSGWLLFSGWCSKAQPWNWAEYVTRALRDLLHCHGGSRADDRSHSV